MLFNFNSLPGDVADQHPVALLVLVHQRVLAADHGLLGLLRPLAAAPAHRGGGRVPLGCAIERSFFFLA